MLPNFFIVGSQKCATTSLHNYLSYHPNVYLPAQKETKFFVSNLKYSKGLKYYEDKYFSCWRGENAVGEVDPDLMYFDDAIKRIADNLDFSKLKIIIILRNPADRAFSHYLMTYRRGLEKLSFEEAIRCEKYRISKGYYEKLHYSYLSRGFYFHQISKILQYGNPNNVLIMLTEDLKKDAKNLWFIICDFLKIERNRVPKNIYKKYHNATIPRSMYLTNRIVNKKETLEKLILKKIIKSDVIREKIKKQILLWNQKKNNKFFLSDNTRCYLSKIFNDDICHLSRLIHKDLSHWIFR